MAKTYRPPAEFEDRDTFVFTDGRYDHEATREAEARYIADLTDWCRERWGSKSDLVGVVYSSPVAAWSLPEAHIRGLRVADIRQEKARSDRLAELFASR